MRLPVWQPDARLRQHAWSKLQKPGRGVPLVRPLSTVTATSLACAAAWRGAVPLGRCVHPCGHAGVAGGGKKPVPSEGTSPSTSLPLC